MFYLYLKSLLSHKDSVSQASQERSSLIYYKLNGHSICSSIYLISLEDIPPRLSLLSYQYLQSSTWDSRDTQEQVTVQHTFPDRAVRVAGTTQELQNCSNLQGPPNTLRQQTFPIGGYSYSTARTYTQDSVDRSPVDVCRVAWMLEITGQNKYFLLSTNVLYRSTGNHCGYCMEMVDGRTLEKQ